MARPSHIRRVDRPPLQPLMCVCVQHARYNAHFGLYCVLGNVSFYSLESYRKFKR